MRIILTFLNLFLIHQSWAYKEILSILENERDLRIEERNALFPLFQEMQLQYDFIMEEISQNKEKEKDNQKVLTGGDSARALEEPLKQFHLYFEEITNRGNRASNAYDSQLPTITELLNATDLIDLSREQQLELQDVQNIMRDTLDQAEQNINQLVEKSLEIETNLLKLNKPDIILLILKALGVLFNVASQVSRAAYCTYSHVPELNISLQHMYEGADCYTYTTFLVATVQQETMTTISTMKKNIRDMAAIYKKVASQNSLLGKILTLVLNFTEIARNIIDSYKTAMHALNGVQHQLPSAALEVTKCSKNFAVKIPCIVETVSNVTECITFVDDTTYVYDFMLPENSERNMDFQNPKSMNWDEE
uniref:Protein TsetseEP domain-containing protein n=1 Tax=Glossina pallidipes TaxID=7398 RepID=A0A1A9Z9N1_GLOPL